MSVWMGFVKCFCEKCVCSEVKRIKAEIRSVTILTTAWCSAEMRLCVDFYISAVGPSLVKERKKIPFWTKILKKNLKLYFLG